MHKRNFSAHIHVSQMTLDALIICAAYFISTSIYNLIQNHVIIFGHLWMLPLFLFIFVLTMYLLRMYDQTTFYYLDRIISRTAVSTIFGGLFLTMVIFLLKLDTTSRLMFVIFCLLSGVLVVLVRILEQFANRSGKTINPQRILFVGDMDIYKEYSHYVSQTAIRDKFVCTLPHHSPVFASNDCFEKYLQANKIDGVNFVYSPGSQFDFHRYMQVCEEMGLTVNLVLDLFDMPLSKKYVSSVGTFPVVTYHSVSADNVQKFIKRVVDFYLSFWGIILLSPVFLITAIFIKLDSKGPVFFRQTRVGRNGKEFKIYKFRSMYLGSEEKKSQLSDQNQIKDGLMFKMENDPRITKVGAFLRKTSIDELPQLFNVLKGDMSLVGTRPPTLDEVERYDRHHWRRISIRPGITGMWQVCGRSQILDFDKVVELDTQYIDQWSLLLDFKLLLKTFGVVLTRKGAR